MPDARETRSLAVLFDADNTSAKHAQAIFDEFVKLGEANVRRIYGDSSGGRLAGWDAAAKRLKRFGDPRFARRTADIPPEEGARLVAELTRHMDPDD